MEAGKERLPIGSKIWPYRILRDVILVELFAGIGGFLIGFGIANTEASSVNLAASIGSLVMVPIALSIVGIINSNNRWFHLAMVTLACFILDTGFEMILFNRAFSFLTIAWYFTYFIVGGLLSMLYPVFKNREKVSQDEQ